MEIHSLANIFKEYDNTMCVHNFAPFIQINYSLNLLSTHFFLNDLIICKYKYTSIFMINLKINCTYIVLRQISSRLDLPDIPTRHVIQSLVGRYTHISLGLS